MRSVVILGSAIACCCGVGLPFVCNAQTHLPPLMHGESFDAEADVDVTLYYVSEKLDGVRAYWNGKQLLTRAGNPIAAPAWFTRGWPTTSMDGELWAGRGRFERTSGIVRTLQPNDDSWRELTYRAFDLPAEAGSFEVRLQRLQALVQNVRSEWLHIVEQMPVEGIEQLRAQLARVEAAGGEGLMLRRRDSWYVAGRSNDLLKFKSFDDAEAVVVAHLPGQGKYEGMMGAVLVETADGRRFRIGSGFTDRDRHAPPAIGQRITYAYNGLTERGLPRFARYRRPRHVP